MMTWMMTGVPAMPVMPVMPYFSQVVRKKQAAVIKMAMGNRKIGISCSLMEHHLVGGLEHFFISIYFHSVGNVIIPTDN